MGIKQFFDKFKPYEVDIVCENCGCPNKAKLPRGMKVTEFVQQGKCVCSNCGVVFNPKEYKTKWLK